MPKLSVITICKNEKDSIGKTIESVLKQTFKDFEYIVIDGLSNDGTLDAIKKYESQLSHFISEEDSGIYNAQNKGIKLAKGEYLLFLNAGDYLCDNNVFSDIFSQEHSESIIYGNMKIDDKGKIIDGFSPENISLYFMLGSTLWHPVSFIKRDLFDKYGLYDEKFKIVADYEFFLRTICVNNQSTKHFNRFVTVFNTEGIGSSVKFQELHNKERKAAQLKNFPESVIDLYQNYKHLNESNIFVRFNFFKDGLKEKFKRFFIG